MSHLPITQTWQKSNSLVKISSRSSIVKITFCQSPPGSVFDPASRRQTTAHAQQKMYAATPTNIRYAPKQRSNGSATPVTTTRATAPPPI